MPRVPGRRGQAQSLVEFAFTLPLLVLVIFSVIQISLVFVAYYSETRMARESSRWLAIRSTTTTDDQFAAHVQATMLPGMIGGTPALVPAETDANGTVYTIGRMHLKFTPCMASGSFSSVCTHAKRAPAETLYVEITYDVPLLLVAKTSPTLRFGSLAVKLPTTLPPYKVSLMVE